MWTSASALGCYDIALAAGRPGRQRPSSFRQPSEPPFTACNALPALSLQDVVDEVHLVLTCPPVSPSTPSTTMVLARGVFPCTRSTVEFSLILQWALWWSVGTSFRLQLLHWTSIRWPKSMQSPFPFFSRGLQCMLSLKQDLVDI